MSIEENSKQKILESEENPPSSSVFGGISPYIQLSDITEILFKYKAMIIVIISIFALASVLYALSLPKYYRASILVVSAEQGSKPLTSLSGLLGSISSTGGGMSPFASSGISSEIALSVLTSRRFIETYIKDNNLLPILFKDAWDEKNNAWIGTDAPTLFDGYGKISNSFEIDFDKSLITVTVEWSDPETAATLANEIIYRVNEHIRTEAIDEGNRSIFFLENELSKTNLTDAKQMLYGLVEQQTQSIMLANVREEYAFKVIDPAVKPIHPSGPNRRFIVLLGLIFGSFTGVFLALVINYIRLNKRITT